VHERFPFVPLQCPFVRSTGRRDNRDEHNKAAIMIRMMPGYHRPDKSIGPCHIIRPIIRSAADANG
jgi:hypothetical protein